jgi:hypothetical protein
VVKIQKVQPTTTVSPSSTAARMGVVDVAVPNITGITQPISDSLNTFGEAQAKLYDANWMNDYEYNTGMWLNNKVNDALLSGENPNLEQFTTESYAYNESILSNAPERLKIAADGWFQQKFITSFEILREQSNNITYSENRNKFDVWYNNIGIDAELEYMNIARSASNPQVAMDMIHEYNGTVLTKLLGSLKSRYEALEPFSQGAMNSADLKVKELQILKQLETSRINAITAAFYQNVNVQDPEEMAAANLAHANFQNDYILNKNNARGVNYDVFTSETGVSVGEEVMNEVITQNNQYVAKIQGNNLIKKAEQDSSEAVSNYSLVEEIETSLSDLKSFNGKFDIFITKEGPAGNFTRTVTFDEMKAYLTNPDGLNLKITDAKIQKLVSLNNAKYKTSQVFFESLENLIETQFQNSETRMSFAINEKLSDDEITLMGGKDNIMDSYYNTIFKNFGYQDTINFYDNADEATMETIAKVFQYEEYIPKGYSDWLNSFGPIQILQMETENITEMMSNRLPTFEFLTGGGYTKPEGMSEDTFKFYQAASQYKQEGIPMNIISQMMKQKAERSKDDTNTIVSNNRDFVSGLEENDLKNFFIESMLDMWKVRFGPDGEQASSIEKGFYSYKFFGAVPARDQAQAYEQAKKFYEDNQPYVESIILERAMQYFEYLSEPLDDDEQRKIRFEKSLMYALNSLEKDNFGMTSFMDNVPGTSFRFMGVEQEHDNIKKKDIQASLAAFTYNNLTRILEDPNHELYEQLSDQFTIPNGEISIPSLEKINELIENGNIYLLYREDGGMGKAANYDVVVQNSGTGYLEPENFDSINTISFDGAAFNPNIYTAGGMLTIDNLRKNVQLAQSKEYGQIDFLNAFEAQFIAPVSVWFAEKAGEIDIEENYVELLAELYADDSFYKYSQFQNFYKDKNFNTEVDKTYLFNNINSSMNEILNIDPKKYNNATKNRVFDYVNEKFGNFNGFQKAFFSRILLDNPELNKQEFENAVYQSDKQYFRNLYTNESIHSFFDYFFKPELLSQKAKEIVNE